MLRLDSGKLYGNLSIIAAMRLPVIFKTGKSPLKRKQRVLHSGKQCSGSAVSEHQLPNDLLGLDELSPKLKTYFPD